MGFDEREGEQEKKPNGRRRRKKATRVYAAVHLKYIQPRRAKGAGKVELCVGLVELRESKQTICIYIW